jgi:hypothetical protein
MKAIIELQNRKHVMTPEQAAEVIALIHHYGTEVYTTKTEYGVKPYVTHHHVYELTPTELGTGELPYLTDAMYGMAKLKGRPE